MTQCVQSARFFRNRKERRDKVLRKMATMRAAKERKRQQAVAAGWTPEPKLVRWHRFELGVRDKLTGETHFVDLKSARYAAKAVGLVLKYCQ